MQVLVSVMYGARQPGERIYFEGNLPELISSISFTMRQNHGGSSPKILSRMPMVRSYTSLVRDSLYSFKIPVEENVHIQHY